MRSLILASFAALGSPACGASEPAPPTFEVRVVDGEAGQPVAGAAVRVLAFEDAYAHWNARVPRSVTPEWTAARERLARVHRCDAQGMARVPVAADWLDLSVDAGGKQAVLAVAPDSREAVRVVLTKSTPVPVRVVDELGRPVEGVLVEGQRCRRPDPEVEIAQGWSGAVPPPPTFQPRLRPRDPYECAWMAETNASGTAWLPFELEHGAAGEPSLRPEPMLHVVLPRRPPRVIEETWSPRLVLPPTGSLEVRSPERSGGLVRIRRVDEPSEEGNPYGGPLSDGTCCALLGGRHGGVPGVARFAHVGVGLRLEVVLRDSSMAEPLVRYADGPRVPGERIVVVLPGPAEQPTVAFRAVDRGGRPLRKREVHCILGYQSDSPEGIHTSGSLAFQRHTDDEGRLVLVLASAGSAARWRRRLEVRLLPGERGTEVDLTGPWPPGTSELGDLVIEDGVVHEDAGKGR